MDLELPILIFLVTFAVEALGWIGKDSITDFVRSLSASFRVERLLINKPLLPMTSLVLRHLPLLLVDSSSEEAACSEDSYSERSSRIGGNELTE